MSLQTLYQVVFIECLSGVNCEHVMCQFQCTCSLQLLMKRVHLSMYLHNSHKRRQIISDCLLFNIRRPYSHTKFLVWILNANNESTIVLIGLIHMFDLLIFCFAVAFDADTTRNGISNVPLRQFNSSIFGYTACCLQSHKWVL